MLFRSVAALLWGCCAAAPWEANPRSARQGKAKQQTDRPPKTLQTAANTLLGPLQPERGPNKKGRKEQQSRREGQQQGDQNQSRKTKTNESKGKKSTRTNSINAHPDLTRKQTEQAAKHTGTPSRTREESRVRVASVGLSCLVCLSVFCLQIEIGRAHV